MSPSSYLCSCFICAGNLHSDGKCSVPKRSGGDGDGRRRRRAFKIHGDEAMYFDRILDAKTCRQSSMEPFPASLMASSVKGRNFDRKHWPERQKETNEIGNISHGSVSSNIERFNILYRMKKNWVHLFLKGIVQIKWNESGRVPFQKEI